MRAGLIPLLFQPESIQHTTRCGGDYLSGTHTPGSGPAHTHTHTHTHSHPNDCTHRQCVRLKKQPQRHKDTKMSEETHKDSHSQTEAHNPTCQACGKGLSQNNESYADTLLLEPLNVSFFLFEDMPAVPDSSWCFHIEHNVSLMPLTH